MIWVLAPKICESRSALAPGPHQAAPCALAQIAEDCAGERAAPNQGERPWPITMSGPMQGPSTGKANWGKVAAYAAGRIVGVLALFLVVAGWNMKSENPVARIRDECQKSYGKLGPARVSECLSELVIRHTRRSSVP